MPVTGEEPDQIGFTFTWQIEDFTLCLQNKKQTIESPVFRIKQFQNTKWKLVLYLPGDDEDNITLNLCRCESDPDGPPRVPIDGKLFLAKTDGSYIFLDKFGYTFFLEIDQHKYEHPLVISRKTVFEDSDMYLFKDTLTVGYQFFVNSESHLQTNVPVECSARSKLSLTKYSIILPLKFPGMFSNYEYSVTSAVASTSTKHPEFQVELHCYDCNKNETPATITVRLVKSNVKGFLVCKLLFLSKEVIKYTCQRNYTFKGGMDGHLWKIDVLKETFDKNSISGANCLKCELVASTGKLTSSLENTVYKQEIPEASVSDSFDVSCLQGNLMDMYDKKILCDFKFIVSNREFYAHKTVLSAVSPVFRAMFESGMTEAEISQVTIKEFSVEAVEKMLEFTYCDRVKDPNWRATLELFAIADKYQIQKLKAICSSFLESALSVETVPDLLVLADLHKDVYLCKVAEDFICGNSKAVFRSEAWKHFMNSNVQVASEKMFRICKLFSELNINPLQ